MNCFKQQNSEENPLILLNPYQHGASSKTKSSTSPHEEKDFTNQTKTASTIDNSNNKTVNEHSNLNDRRQFQVTIGQNLTNYNNNNNNNKNNSYFNQNSISNQFGPTLFRNNFIYDNNDVNNNELNNNYNNYINNIHVIINQIYISLGRLTSGI